MSLHCQCKQSLQHGLLLSLHAHALRVAQAGSHSCASKMIVIGCVMQPGSSRIFCSEHLKRGTLCNAADTCMPIMTSPNALHPACDAFCTCWL